MSKLRTLLAIILGFTFASVWNICCQKKEVSKKDVNERNPNKNFAPNTFKQASGGYFSEVLKINNCLEMLVRVQCIRWQCFEARPFGPEPATKMTRIQSLTNIYIFFFKNKNKVQTHFSFLRRNSILKFENPYPRSQRPLGQGIIF